MTPHDRLRRAREEARFPDAASAARRFGWNNATYRAHENGSRNLTIAAAKRYGQAFRVSPEWLLLGAGPMKRSGTPQPAPETPATGMSDRAVPYQPPPSRQGVGIAEYLAPDNAHLETFRLQSPAPGTGLLPGDLLVVQMKEKPVAGDMVLATVQDLEFGHAETRVLRFLPPHLVTGNPADAPLCVEDARIVGAIVAMARGPGLK